MTPRSILGARCAIWAAAPLPDGVSLRCESVARIQLATYSRFCCGRAGTRLPQKRSIWCAARARSRWLSDGAPGAGAAELSSAGAYGASASITAAADGSLPSARQAESPSGLSTTDPGGRRWAPNRGEAAGVPPPPPPSATAGELAPVAAIVGGRHGECAGVHAPLPAATARAPATAAPRCAAPAAPLRDSPIGAAATPRLAIAGLAAGSAVHPLPSAEPAAAARSLRSHRSQSATKDRSSAGASEAGATPVALVTARAAAAMCAGCKAGAAAGMGAEGAVSSERKTASSEGGGGGGSGAPEWAGTRGACRVAPPPWLLAPSPPHGPAPHAP
mmetsp:Transcript_52/g.166  ORF Transcript_52/g.166 Transcript_52/m.166 type:complete len:332 (-) Transcript_52:1527-2522(-)|eukprot:scaffold24545_cov90-Isochrysis_galbana.AAC.1